MAMQEKMADKQAELDALRAKRAIEEAERQWRRKESAAAERQQSINMTLNAAREAQNQVAVHHSKLTDAFRHFDDDHDGRMTKADVLRMLAQWNLVKLGQDPAVLDDLPTPNQPERPRRRVLQRRRRDAIRARGARRALGAGRLRVPILLAARLGRTVA